jgi:hypothetical protein
MAGASYPDPQAIEIVFAKMMLGKVSKYAQAWGLAAKLDRYIMEEDVLLSMANLVAGHQNYIVPAKKGQRCIPLSEHGQSLSARVGFWESRDAAVKCIMEQAWAEDRRASSDA